MTSFKLRTDSLVRFPVLTFFIILILVVNLLPSRALAEHAGFALAFDGVDDYASLGDTGELFGGDGWAGTKTISLWINPTGNNPPTTAPASGELIVGNDRPRLFGITRALFNGQDRLWIWNADNNGLDVIGIDFTPGEWIQIAMVHTGGSLSAYKNGALVGTIASGDTYVPNGTNDGQMYLGGTGRNNPALYIEGQLDEVQFWSVPLDEALMQAWLYSEVDNSHPEWSGLAAYYQMSAGAGSALPDDSANEHTGALLGGMSDGSWVSSGALEPPGTPAPTSTPAPATSTPTSPAIPPSPSPTNTAPPPTATPTNTAPPPTATPTNTAPPPTATPTNTALPPSPTPTNTALPPSPTPTNTALPPSPTPTNTAPPPTSTPTNTAVPPSPTPTNTAVPPSPTPTPGGTVNYALEFDGANDFVEFSNTTDMMGYGWPNTKTISLWLKPADQAPVCSIPTVAWCDSIFGDRPRWWGISQGVVNGEDRIWVWNYDGSPGSSTDILGIEYTAGEWVHIALVHSGNVLRAYKNGVEVGSTPSGPTLQPPGYPVLHLGGIINSPTRVWTFAGQLDEVRLWNIQRTPAEIIQDMGQPLTGNEPGLAAYYRMSDGAGIVLTDDSANSWNGTLYDGARNVPPDGHLPAWVISGAF